MAEYKFWTGATPSGGFEDGARGPAIRRLRSSEAADEAAEAFNSLEPSMGRRTARNSLSVTYVARVHREARVKGKTYTHKVTGKPFVAKWDQRPS